MRSSGGGLRCAPPARLLTSARRALSGGGLRVAASAHHLTSARRALGLVVVALGACANDGGPRLLEVIPAAAGHGETVAINGQRLCGPTADCARAAGQVQIGIDPPAVQAPIVDLADTTVSIMIPPIAPVGKTGLVLTVDDRSSNAIDFEVLQ